VLPDPEQPENGGGGDDCDAVGQAKPGTAEFIIQVEKKRSIKVTLDLQSHSEDLSLGNTS
jgi:hypothetical protein